MATYLTDTLIPRTKPERLALLKKHSGLLAAVTKRHPSMKSGMVSRVYHGLVTSARIKAAIEAEIRRRTATEFPRATEAIELRKSA